MLEGLLLKSYLKDYFQPTQRQRIGISVISLVSEASKMARWEVCREEFKVVFLID